MMKKRDGIYHSFYKLVKNWEILFEEIEKEKIYR